ncbi:peptidylprolyl isomerase [Patescibacteria group bacterium]
MESNVVAIETDKGKIVIDLFPKNAPLTVEKFKTLINDGFYNGLTFHRVVQDFVVQGGDPSGDGTGGPGYEFEDEINAKSLGLKPNQIKSLEEEGYSFRDDIKSKKMLPGMLAMANSGPNTNGSQFFIVLGKPQPHLNGRHTVFGKVRKGMDVVEKIEVGDAINLAKLQ